MKKMKSITMNEFYYKYTGEPKDYLRTGDILHFRQQTLLDRPNLFAWIVDYFHADRIASETPFFSHLCSTDYCRAENPAVDLEAALKWLNELYPGLEQIDVDRRNAFNGCPLSIFGKREDFNKIKADFDNMMDELRKKHPEALISCRFNWDWRG